MTSTGDMDAPRVRAARNQSLFREVNERLEDIASTSSFASFVCECARIDCDERVSLTIQEYEGIRSDSNAFFVVAGHELPEVEDVVDATSRYLVVRKLPPGDAVARSLDPRLRRGGGAAG